ncbi:hypothetical protein C1I58_26445 [Bacillus sp. PIC28]|uniref:Uncharacterized protein n=1 Tax=Bacillus cereus (strain ATCC 14579 / DSM 31 / CCUG 7414 / JCM 2152 / NBRC 15305 / NCIMB 9373 / NCTC 2599 / NRRL B-3711) TaxID=226900 RepID=Q815N9_BACCR|nr:hypothetical protein BC_5102 [Bacillus cereus ATCC 14579]MBR9667433.1 hypothetical protein [Bacillus cereus]QCC43201.1 hypothetical protein C3Y97_26470 [Bacillus sp. DU-106]TKV44939.1 hypothetical protein C1I58_26445 [Bacillus sp. PIC28]
MQKNASPFQVCTKWKKYLCIIFQKNSACFFICNIAYQSVLIKV